MRNAHWHGQFFAVPTQGEFGVFRILLEMNRREWQHELAQVIY